MNPTKSNKEQFAAYLKSINIATNTINSYQSSLNKKVTESIRNLCNVELGSIFGVVDLHLLASWMNTLKDNEEFNSLNQETHNALLSAFKKYVEYLKHLSKQSNR